MTIKLTIEVKVDDGIYGSSEPEIQWLTDEILVTDGTLILHSNEIGDEIGHITKVSNIEFIKP